VTNPYRWDTERPAHPLERDTFAKLAALLALGGRAMVHAGHGMGKSVLLGWLEDKLTAQGLRVLRLGAPEGQTLAEALRGRLDPATGPRPLARRSHRPARPADLRDGRSTCGSRVP